MEEGMDGKDGMRCIDSRLSGVVSGRVRRE